MLLSKERCSVCRSERAVRKCSRKNGKMIGWNCCNDLRVDLRCPEPCPYAAAPDKEHISPFPAFRADSNTEFTKAARKYVDIWCHQSLPELEGISPAEFARQDSAALLAWLGKFRYPANFPVAYLMGRLGIPHEEQIEPETPETVALAFMEAVIAADWDKLRSFTGNDLDWPELAKRYSEILTSIRELQKTRDCAILHAGLAEDGVSAIVVFELNRKRIWTVLLSSAGGSWKVRQNLNGSPNLYYEQNKLFHKLADALAKADEQACWQALQTSFPLYPDCADLYYYRALYWQLSKQPLKTKDDLLNALALDNHYFAAGFTLATFYLNDRELQPALKLLKILTQDRPDDLNVRNNIAACEAGLDNITEAVKIWREILNTAPNYEPARKNLERFGH